MKSLQEKAIFTALLHGASQAQLESIATSSQGPNTFTIIFPKKGKFEMEADAHFTAIPFPLSKRHLSSSSSYHLLLTTLKSQERQRASLHVTESIPQKTLSTFLGFIVQMNPTGFCKARISASHWSLPSSRSYE